MKILVADDDPLSRHLLRRTLERWGHEVVVANDGLEAWAALTGVAPPKLAILDWTMPGMTGVELCRVARCLPHRPLYIILLTVRQGREHAITGLDAGADDYIIKPFDAADLHARLRAGLRVLERHADLAGEIERLRTTLARADGVVRPLPICSYCRRVRNEDETWGSLEALVTSRFGVELSHGICPVCAASKARRDLGPPPGLPGPHTPPEVAPRT